MAFYYIPAAVLLSFLILLVPSKVRYTYSFLVNVLIAAITTIPSVNQIAGCLTNVAVAGTGAGVHLPDPVIWSFSGIFGELQFTIDPLSAFFILVTNFTALTGLLYSRGYLAHYRNTKNPAQFALHYFSYTWLYLSMLAVLSLRDGTAFLIAWELMAVSSFMLILFEAEQRVTLKTAVNYLVQMHIGFILLLLALLITGSATGDISFDSLPAYFATHRNAALFFLFFSGFAIKAGFIPFHTWLPEAHPAAPSHVSGVMSGVMIKMGIYGIIRVLLAVQSDLFLIGWCILVLSAISGLMGVMLAITQHDLKKLLAYHSIENIGIIGMGIGLGAIGLGTHHPMLALLGFAGGMLHVLNHSLFKSLLFFTSGSVYQACHTRDTDSLGGLIRKMPHTAGLFLVGAIAICGLPPLNGFISEFLIYFGLFSGLNGGSIYQSLTMLLAIVSLALIGGLAIFCFTKAFGVVFLGTLRKDPGHPIEEADRSMLFPQYLIAGMILLIGFLPLLFAEPLFRLVTAVFRLPAIPYLPTFDGIFTYIPLLGVILVVLASGILIWRNRLAVSRTPEYRPTWGCGSTDLHEKQQYTGTSYAANFIELAQPVLQNKKEFKEISEQEIFPGHKSFAIHPNDIFNTFLSRLNFHAMAILKYLARLQTGNIRHYILYAFLFIILLLALLYLHVI